ncbi:DUF4411 domain-containing protein [Amycolatopsis sp. WAC 04197]|uniref:DUF4411 family protein n=1 Tax=Amycolatopsis sp. WAC 04197 TaxID=2203199 RepID=UPI000F794E23|nr:DUF4411 family protein [Amycolatopsis sp. WAC 04197]RSN45253.1 DUF4411 domain-containing protein [Amycolatopsis sp. WAC 04197]
MYSFDTSAILNGRRDQLPPSVFSTLWQRIEMLIAEGTIRAVEVVRDELGKRDDEANTWARSQGDLFLPLDQDIQVSTRKILQAHPKMMGTGGGRNGADPFVIGLALARTGVVVTDETFSGNLNKPRIPDVCKAVSVPCTNLVGFVQAQGWKF